METTVNQQNESMMLDELRGKIKHLINTQVSALSPAYDAYYDVIMMIDEIKNKCQEAGNHKNEDQGIEVGMLY